MERKLRTLSKNHSDRDGDLLPEFDDGNDIYQIDIPNGKKYSRYVLEKDCFLGESRVTTSPRNGSTGRVRFNVQWNYVSFGKANYDLKVYVVDRREALPPIAITFGSPNWEERAKGAIESGRRVKINVIGPQALLLYPLIWGRRSRELLESQEEVTNSEEDIIDKEIKIARVAGVDDAVIITAIICTTVLASVIFIGLGVIIMSALDKGLCVNANTGAINLLTGGIGEVSLDIHSCGNRGKNVDETEEIDSELIERLDEIDLRIEEVLTGVQELKKKQIAIG